LQGIDVRESKNQAGERPFRVLSLDGGGVRGLYTASLLYQLCVRSGSTSQSSAGCDFGAQFDLIVGTSTGSIVATALAAGAPLTDVIELYKTKSRAIFQRQMPSNRRGFFGQLKILKWAFIDSLCKAANDPAPLKCALTDVLGEETFKQLYERRRVALCIPTIDAYTQRGWVFKPPHVPRMTRDDDTKLVDACLASSAAPIYFPLHGIKNAQPGNNTISWFVDGGLWANNPILVALAEVIEILNGGVNRPVHILSVGTGGAPKANIINSARANRGIGGWLGGLDIVSMSLDSQANTTAYLASRIASAIPNVRLFRLKDAPVAPEESGYLGLDTGAEEAIDLILKRAGRAADENWSYLTSVDDDPERAIFRGIFLTSKLYDGGGSELQP